MTAPFPQVTEKVVMAACLGQGGAQEWAHTKEGRIIHKVTLSTTSLCHMLPGTVGTYPRNRTSVSNPDSIVSWSPGIRIFHVDS